MRGISKGGKTVATLAALVLFCAPGARAADVVEVAAGNEKFQTLVAAVKAAGLVATLKGKGPFTIFPPTDSAFADLPRGTSHSSERDGGSPCLGATVRQSDAPESFTTSSSK